MEGSCACGNAAKATCERCGAPTCREHGGRHIDHVGRLAGSRPLTAARVDVALAGLSEEAWICVSCADAAVASVELPACPDPAVEACWQAAEAAGGWSNLEHRTLLPLIASHLWRTSADEPVELEIGHWHYETTGSRLRSAIGRNGHTVRWVHQRFVPAKRVTAYSFTGDAGQRHTGEVFVSEDRLFFVEDGAHVFDGVKVKASPTRRVATDASANEELVGFVAARAGSFQKPWW